MLRRSCWVVVAVSFSLSAFAQEENQSQKSKDPDHVGIVLPEENTSEESSFDRLRTGYLVGGFRGSYDGSLSAGLHYEAGVRLIEVERDDSRNLYHYSTGTASIGVGRSVHPKGGASFRASGGYEFARSSMDPDSILPVAAYQGLGFDYFADLTSRDRSVLESRLRVETGVTNNNLRHLIRLGGCLEGDYWSYGKKEQSDLKWTVGCDYEYRPNGGKSVTVVEAHYGQHINDRSNQGENYIRSSVSHYRDHQGRKREDRGFAFSVSFEHNDRAYADSDRIYVTFGAQ